jgi:hypothetical protein
MTMCRVLRLLLASLLLIAPSAASAAAQEVTGFLTLEQMQEAVARMRETMFAPGAAVPDWNRGGANPDSALRAAGADRFYYLLRKTGGDGVAILTERPLASFVPEGWRIVDTYGDSSARVGNAIVQFEAFSERYVIGVRAGSERRGDVDCIEGIANAALYERPGARRGADDDTIPLLFRLGLLAGEGQTICTRYDGDRATGWRGRNFTPDGRRLPQLDDEHEVLTIVPAAPIESLIVYRPPPVRGPSGT